MSDIIEIIVKPPRTTITWSDGSFTTVILSNQDSFNEETGILWCIAKHYMSATDILEAILGGRDSIKKYSESLRTIKE